MSLKRLQRVELDRLMPVVYHELKALAARSLSRERANHTLQATALAHEVYLRFLEQRQPNIGSERQFLVAAARVLRRILVNHANAKRCLKRGGGKGHVEWKDDVADSTSCPLDILALDEALEELTSLDPRLTRIVELKFFCGLTSQEIATALDLSVRTVDGEWAMARSWLGAKLDGGLHEQ